MQSISEQQIYWVNCITIIFEKRWLICLFADADEIDFQDRAHFRSLRLENNWLVELTRDEGRGWTFSVDFIDLSWPQTTTLVPSSSFYVDDKPSGVFAVLSYVRLFLNLRPESPSILSRHFFDSLFISERYYRYIFRFFKLVDINRRSKKIIKFSTL